VDDVVRWVRVPISGSVLSWMGSCRGAVPMPRNGRNLARLWY